MMMMMIIIMMMFNDHQLFLSLQEVSIHVYEKRGTERVGRGRRKEAIAEILKVIEIDFDYVEEHFFMNQSYTQGKGRSQKIKMEI